MATKPKPGKLDIRSIETHLEQSSKRTNEPPIGFGGRPPNAKAFFVNREIAATGDNVKPKPNFVLPIKSPKSPLKSPQVQSPPIQSQPVKSPPQSPQIKTPPATRAKPKPHVKEPENIEIQKEEPAPVKTKKVKEGENDGLKTINAPPKRTIPPAASVFEENTDDNKAHEQEEDLVAASNREHNGGNLYEVTILPSENTESGPISPPPDTSPDTTQDNESEEECLYDNIINLTAHLNQGIQDDSSDDEAGIKGKGISDPEN